jgi:RNA recognition motif-containing protein
MLTVDEAKRAVEELHDKEFLGRKLVVSGAKSSEHQSAN